MVPDERAAAPGGALAELHRVADVWTAPCRTAVVAGGLRAGERIRPAGLPFTRGGAGGARTHDRRIIRTTARRSRRSTCTDTVEPCHRWPSLHCMHGWLGPRTGPRPPQRAPDVNYGTSPHRARSAVRYGDAAVIIAPCVAIEQSDLRARPALGVVGRASASPSQESP